MSGDPNAPLTPMELTPGVVRRARRLLIVFSVVLAIWIAAMLAMYFTTVYPQRHPASVPTNGLPR